MALWILLGIAAVTAAVGLAFVKQPSFGRLPRNERLERVKRSPNYRDGEFRNLQSTPMFTSDKGRLGTMLGFLFRRQENLRPAGPIPIVKSDLHKLSRDQDLLVWFGHSSYLLQLGGKRFLVDPVFCTAAPVAFVNRPFEGPDLFRAEDMPDVDYLIITHDHWDHLDYRTVTQLKERVGRVVCPLGVGEHFEYWGFDEKILIELDWHETAAETGVHIHCLPARHFSGRGTYSNQTLWASFLLETPSMQVFIAGDGGYGDHFARIGEQFPAIDLAILENGQYNTDWRYIHTMPEYLPRVAKDLKAKSILTVHHSKYALAKHPWDEPLENARKLIRTDSQHVFIPVIGEVVEIGTGEGKGQAKTGTALQPT